MRLGEPQGRSGRVRKFSPQTGIQYSDWSDSSNSLYRLRYPGPKFSLCLYTVFVSQLPHHGFPQDAIFQFLHLFLRRNQSPSYFACSFTCFAIWVTLPVFHNSRGITAIAETVHGAHVRIYFFCKVWRVVTTPPYHSAATATSHGSVRAEIRESSRSASLLH